MEHTTETVPWDDQMIRWRDSGSVTLVDTRMFITMNYDSSGKIDWVTVPFGVDASLPSLPKEYYTVSTTNFPVYMQMAQIVSPAMFDHILALLHDTSSPGTKMTIDTFVIMYLAARITNSGSKGISTRHSAFRNYIRDMERLSHGDIKMTM